MHVEMGRGGDLLTVGDVGGVQLLRYGVLLLNSGQSSYRYDRKEQLRKCKGPG